MERGRPEVPPWLDRLAAVGWRVLVIVAMLAVLYLVAAALSLVTASILVGFIAAVALAPTVRRFRSGGLSPPIASALACLIGLAVVIGVVVVVALALVPNLPAIIESVQAGVVDLRQQLVELGAPAAILNAVDALIAQVLAVDVGRIAGSAITVGTVLVLGGFLTYFLLADGATGWAWATRPLDPERAQTLTASAEPGLVRASGYLRRTAVLAVVDAAVLGLLLVVLGVPLAGPLAVLVFFLGFVPYLGAIITAVVVGLSAIATTGPWAGGAVLAAMLITSLVAQRLMERTSIGSAVDVQPAWVLVALPAGVSLFGVLGLVAILPVTVLLAAISRALVLALAGPRPPHEQRADEMAPWLDRLAQWSWRGLVVAGLIALVIAVVARLPLVVVVLVLATVLAATILPVARRLRGLGWTSGWAAAAATGGVGAAITAAIVVTVAWTLGPLREIAETALAGVSETGLAFLADAVANLTADLVIDLGALVGGAARLAVVVTLVVLLTFFFLRDGAGWWRRWLASLSEPRRARLDQAGSRAVGVLSGYMTGTAVIAAFGAVTSAIIMIVLGLPLAIPIGLLTFFGGFIPIIGSFVTTVLAFFVAVAVGTPFDIVVMGIWTIVFNIVQGSFVTPLVYGRTFRLHPAVILLAIPAGGQVAGILGMFLVVPFVAIVAAIWPSLTAAISPDPA